MDFHNITHNNSNVKDVNFALGALRSDATTHEIEIQADEIRPSDGRRLANDQRRVLVIKARSMLINQRHRQTCQEGGCKFRLRLLNWTWTWIIHFLVNFIVVHSAAALNGEHVCLREERYFVNITEYFPRNVTIRSFQWCMQVPPRCSTFSFKIINDSRIIEQEKIRQIPECCEGFESDFNGEKCVPSCRLKCTNGKCNDENKCYCKPGFRGDFCETACDPNRWGRYCRYICECQRGRCDPDSGRCECPAGWMGIRCNQKCPYDKFGPNCAANCECHDEQICDPQDGRCTNKVKLAVLKKYHTFDTLSAHLTTAIPQISNAKKIDMYLLTTTTELTASKQRNSLTFNHKQPQQQKPNLHQTEEENKNVIKPLNSTGILISAKNATNFSNFDSNRGNNKSTELITDYLPTNQGLTTPNSNANPAKVNNTTQNGNYRDKITSGQAPANLEPSPSADFKDNYKEQKIEDKLDADLYGDHHETNIKSMDRMMQAEISSKGKVDDEVDAVRKIVNITHISSGFDSSSEIFKLNSNNFNNSNNSNYSNNNNFATISFLCIIILGVVGFLFATKLFKRQERKLKKNRDMNGNSGKIGANVANKPKSIFHTPLPEPPQSPFFDSPPCAHFHQRIGENNVAVNPRLSLTSVSSARMNCLSLPFIDENHESAEELSDVFYDQLPSTHGSYKAASVPEPPPMPLIQKIEEETSMNCFNPNSSGAQSLNVENSTLYKLPRYQGLQGLQEQQEFQGLQEIKTLHTENNEQKQKILINEIQGGNLENPKNSEILENFYDEIPCWTRSTDNDNLYINTRIENKTQF